MSGATQSFFSAQALHFSEGRIEAMARPYLTPLPVEIEGEYYLLRRRSDVVAAFTAKRAGITAAGIDRLRIGVLEERWLRPGKLAVNLEWFYVDASGTRQGRTKGRYFLRRHDGGLAVEMLALTELALPEIRDWFVAYADPAARQAAAGLH